MRQATAFIRQLGNPGRASAGTRPTGRPVPRCTWLGSRLWVLGECIMLNLGVRGVWRL